MAEIAESYRALRAESMILLHRGQVEKATDLLQAIPEPDAVAWNDLGALQYERGLFDAAANCFRHAMHDPEGACNLGVALLELERKEEALFRFGEVLASWPGHARSHVLLGSETGEGTARMEVRRVVPGQLVSVIRRVRFSGDDLCQEWKGRVHSVTDSTISLSYPRVWPTLTPFRKGSRVMLGMAADDAFWSVCVEVEEPPLSEVPILVIKHYGELRRVQRREGVRIECPELTAVAHGTGSAVETRVRDLSTSGVGLVAPKEFPLGSPARVDLPVGGEVFEIQGRVARREEAQKGHFLLGVAFQALRTQVQDRLARFVNRVQLERRRGLR